MTAIKESWRLRPFYLFIYAGAIFIVYGGITLGIPSVNQSTNITIIETQHTNIELPIVNLSNNTQLLTLNSTNITYYKTDTSSSAASNYSPLEEARLKLGSGMFSNGFALIGLGLSLFSLGYTYWSNVESQINFENIIAQIQNRRTGYKTVLDPRYYYYISLLWIVVGFFYTIILLCFTNNFVIFMIVVGLIILLFGVIEERKLQPIVQPSTSVSPPVSPPVSNDFSDNSSTGTLENNEDETDDGMYNLQFP